MELLFTSNKVRLLAQPRAARNPARVARNPARVARNLARVAIKSPVAMMTWWMVNLGMLNTKLER
jgi:hypothetical protein